MFIIDLARSEAVLRSAETARRNEGLRAQAERHTDALPGTVARRMPRAARRFGRLALTPSAR